MEFNCWLRFYDKINKDLGFSREADEKASKALSVFLRNPDIDLLKKLISGNDVNVFGAGPSIERIRSLPPGINIVADGVTSLFLKKKIVPDIIVTDLDGKIKDIIKASERGSIIFLHGHGDNIHLIKKYGKYFDTLYGTTQSKPFGNLLNFGGFTDGDRSVFLAEHFKPSEITLYGMDFDMKPGKYSYTKNKDIPIKIKKLSWAKILVDYIINTSDIKITFNSKS